MPCLVHIIIALTETLGSVHMYWLGHDTFSGLPHPSVCIVSWLSFTLCSRGLIIYSQTQHTFFLTLNFLYTAPSPWNFSFLSFLRSSKLCQRSFSLYFFDNHKCKSLSVLYTQINWINIYLCTHCIIFHLIIYIYIFYFIVNSVYRKAKLHFQTTG